MINSPRSPSGVRRIVKMRASGISKHRNGLFKCAAVLRPVYAQNRPYKTVSGGVVLAFGWSGPLLDEEMRPRYRGKNPPLWVRANRGYNPCSVHAS